MVLSETIWEPNSLLQSGISARELYQTAHSILKSLAANRVWQRSYSSYAKVRWNCNPETLVDLRYRVLRPQRSHTANVCSVRADDLAAHQVLLEYNSALEQANLIDFEDMLSKTGSLLALPGVQEFVSKQYAHILVDEFQVGDGADWSQKFVALGGTPFWLCGWPHSNSVWMEQDLLLSFISPLRSCYQNAAQCGFDLSVITCNSGSRMSSREHTGGNPQRLKLNPTATHQ